MQEKMKKLLKEINMKNDGLENCSIDKVIVYDNNKLWHFVLKNDTILPLHIYNELLNNLQYTFSDIREIILTINVEKTDDNYLDDYFGMLINKFSNESYKYRVFLDRKLKIKENNYIFEVDNRAEYTYLTEKLEYINSKLNSYGFKKGVKIIIAEEKEKELLNKIEEEKAAAFTNVSLNEKGLNETKKEDKKYFKPKKDTCITPIKDMF